MRVFKLIYVLYKMKLFSPSGLYRLVSALCKYGVNVMALLGFAERVYGDGIALVDDNETVSYRQLLLQSERLYCILKEEYMITYGKKVGFLCKNHGSLVKSIFAVSLLGADIYLLNAEMSSRQFDKLLGLYDFSLIIHDFELSPLVEQSGYDGDRILSYHDNFPAVNNLLNTRVIEKPMLKRASMGKIVILTGGTTGDFKAAVHKPSVLNFLNPFVTLLTGLKLMKYNTAYIATPVYHGYGVAILFLFISLGKKIIVCRGFDAEKACRLINKHNVEVVTVVPLMIHKMLKHNAEDLKSLECIASGGAKLSPRLAEETLSTLGDVLYNLYGTSEAGLNMVATPRDLRYSSKTIGRKIKGVGLKVLDDRGSEAKPGSVGQFCIKNGWSMRNRREPWIKTGDLGYRDSNGYYFLCGRVDDMVVSAGENVYPAEVEQVLLSHPQLEDAAVIGVSDEVFGQRLKAFVQPVRDAGITKEELYEWLRSRVARFQMPKEITFVDSMPYTPLGKLDKKQLKGIDNTGL